MIDVHCHLEQDDYEKDREKVIEKCAEELNALITSCAHPNNLDLTLGMIEDYEDFLFASAGLHPLYIKEISEKEKDEYLKKVRKNIDRFVAVGEIGLDYWHTRERTWRRKQKELFVELINFSKEFEKPIVVHSRESCKDAIDILESENAKQVLMHMFSDKHLVKRVLDNHWMISTNAIVLSSKNYRKIVRDSPLESLMLETDSPWLSPTQLKKGIKSRNDPTSVKVVAAKISEIKKIPIELVDKRTTENAVRFFSLTIPNLDNLSVSSANPSVV